VYAERVLGIKPESVLVSVPKRVAGVAESSESRLLWHHLQKSVQVIEAHPAARVLIKALMHASAVELPSKSEIVFVCLPRKTVEYLGVCVNALPWIARGGSKLGKEACCPCRIRR